MNRVCTYLLMAGPAQGDLGRLDRLSYWLQHSVVVEGYWNYMPFVYGIKSRLSASELRSNLTPVLGAAFMVAEINVMNIDGQLPSEAWPWFYAPPAPRASGLAGLYASGPQQTLPLGLLGGEDLKK